MDSERMDILDNYAFHFLEDVEEPFIQLVAIGRESRHSSRYHLENSGRGASYLFQYTLAGSGTVRINAIFECHGAQRYCGQIELPGILQGDRGEAHRLPDQDPSGPGCGHADSRGRKRWGDRDGMRVFRRQLFQQGVQKAYGHDALGVSGVCEAGGVFEDADISCESLFQKSSE